MLANAAVLHAQQAVPTQSSGNSSEAGSPAVLSAPPQPVPMSPAAAGEAPLAPNTALPADPELDAVTKRMREAPRVFYTGTGQFEIIVADARDAQPALALGDSVWRSLAGPIGLPAGGFATPVSIRLVPAEKWDEASVFTALVEPPGRVVMRVRWAEDVDPVIVRRAFVQGVLLQQAVALHGVTGKLTVPLWLEQACTAFSMIRERPALLDQFQQEAATVNPPALVNLLTWERGAVESRAWELSSLWFFLQIQSESGDVTRWTSWLRATLGGATPMDSLPRAYQGLWASPLAMEQWWQVVAKNQQRASALPVMNAVESRAWMANRARWLGGRNGREIVIPLRDLLEAAKEPWVATELKERSRQTQGVLGVLHPFYVNAAVSMGRLYEAAAKRDEKRFATALADFERDALDARELEDTVGEILDTAPRK